MSAASASHQTPRTLRPRQQQCFLRPHGTSPILLRNAKGTLPIPLAIKKNKEWFRGSIHSLHKACPTDIEQANLGKQHPLMHAMGFQGDDNEDLIDPSLNAEPMEGVDGSEG